MQTRLYDGELQKGTEVGPVQSPISCHNAFFFSVQRLHGFRQVVTHVQPQQKDEL